MFLNGDWLIPLLISCYSEQSVVPSIAFTEAFRNCSRHFPWHFQRNCTYFQISITTTVFKKILSFSINTEAQFISLQYHRNFRGNLSHTFESELTYWRKLSCFLHSAKCFFMQLHILLEDWVYCRSWQSMTQEHPFFTSL